MLMLTESGLTRQQYTLFSLDMFPSGEGEWEENARYELSRDFIVVANTSDSEAMKAAIFEELRNTWVPKFFGMGSESCLAPNATLDNMLVDDYACTGEWLEIRFGSEDSAPVFGLQLLDEKDVEEVISVADQWRAITAKMPQSPENSKRGFWYDEDAGEILTRNGEVANTIANFLEDVLGVTVVTGDYAELDGIPGAAWYITTG